MQPKSAKLIVSTALLLLFLIKGFSQDRTISGKVQTKSNIGISGAFIQASDSKKTAVTDNAGNFTISVKANDKALIINSLGFLSERFPLKGKTDFTFTLQDDTKDLGDVVVTALGIKREVRKLGYATSEVKGNDLTKARDVNAVQGLTGKVAGLTVGASAEMLARPQIVLRGSTDLLFVVDGVPINSDTWNVSADDIESYNVLKGPNAAALYGFRGINGAIIITTKRGSKEKKGWQVDVNSSTMFEKGFVTVPKAQTEYGRGSKFLYGKSLDPTNPTNGYGDQLYDNSQRIQEYGPRFEGQLMKQYDSPYDPVTGIRTATPWTARGADNFEKFMEMGLLSTNNISLSTSGSNYDIRMSYSHIYQKGQAPNTKVNADNVNINAGYNLTPKLRMEGNLNLNLQYSPNIPDASYGPNSYVYMFKVYGSADYNIDDLKDIYKGPQGVPNLVQYAQEYGRENSAWFIAKKWLRSHDKTDVYGYLKLSYKVLPYLNLSVRSQITTWNQRRTEQVPSSTNLNAYLSWYYFGWYGDYREDRRNLLENNTDFLATFDKKIKNWGVIVNAGASERSFTYNSFYGTTKDLAIPNVYVLSNSINPALEYTYGSKMQVYSGYYTVDLAYKNYFNINTTGRVDNLSTLASGYNTFFYPSVSASTVLNDYLKLPSAISYLKVRASYADVKGALTSSAIPSAYTAVTGVSTGSLLGYGTDLYTSYDGPSYTNQNAYSIASYYNGQTSVNYSNTIANQTLKPFDVQSYEAGVDVRLFKNRLGVNATYFNTINGPSIYSLGVAPSTGYYAHNVNGITSLKKGFELDFLASPLKSSKGLNWDISFNYATYKETLKSIYGAENALLLNNHYYKVGERLDNYYSTKFVRDGSGNIVFAGGAPLSAPGVADKSNLGLIGHLNPDFTFGVNNKFSYGSFSLSFQFDGRIGGKVYDRVLYQGNNGGTSLQSASGDFGVARLAEWNVAKANGALPASYAGAYVGKGVVITGGTPHYTNGQIDNLSSLTFAQNTQATTVQGYLSSGLGSNFDEYYYVNRSFVKLREVVLSYHMPSKYLNKNSVFKSVTFSLIGRNLLYFAHQKDFDVEQYAAGFNIADRSAQAYPDLQSATSRRFGFNVNVSF